MSFEISSFAICEVLQGISYVVGGRKVERGRERRSEQEGGREGSEGERGRERERENLFY